jgi:hypothetical protein
VRNGSWELVEKGRGEAPAACSLVVGTLCQLLVGRPGPPRPARNGLDLRSAVRTLSVVRADGLLALGRITVNDFKGAFRFDVASRILPFQTTIICTRYRTRTFSLSRDPACARILSRSSREIEFGAGLHDMARVSNEGLAAWERLYGGATA